jgi:pimeloyl-ACP methyl ester carboxylesterase
MKCQIASTLPGGIEDTEMGMGPIVRVCHGTSSNCYSTVASLPMAEAGFTFLTPSPPGYCRTHPEVGPTAAEAANAMVTRLDAKKNAARQTLASFSTHDPDDSLSRLSSPDLQETCAFFNGQSSLRGALNDLTHTVGADLLAKIPQPTLIVHSREDRAVPFDRAEWSLPHISQAELFEAGFTGHFYWIGPDFMRINEKIISFLSAPVTTGVVEWAETMA